MPCPRAVVGLERALVDREHGLLELRPAPLIPLMCTPMAPMTAQRLHPVPKTIKVQLPH